MNRAEPLKPVFHRGHHNKIAAALGRGSGRFIAKYKDELSEDGLTAAHSAMAYMVAEMTAMLIVDNPGLDDEMYKRIMSEKMVEVQSEH